MRRINAFVEPAVGHFHTRLSDNSKRRNEFALPYIRSADKQLSYVDTDIVLTFCVISDRLLFLDGSICVWY